MKLITHIAREDLLNMLGIEYSARTENIKYVENEINIKSNNDILLPLTNLNSYVSGEKKILLTIGTIQQDIFEDIAAGM